MIIQDGFPTRVLCSFTFMQEKTNENEGWRRNLVWNGI